MIRLGLIGYPVSYSLSPKIHNAALQEFGLSGEYSLFPVHPHDSRGLKDMLERVRSGEITGLNVTIPHKQNVIPLLDELTPRARSIGAVNVIYRQGQKLVGENTDAPGFLADLKKFLAAESQGHADLQALVLGAGGSARAIVYALLHDGWKIAIAARRSEQAQQLSQWFAKYDVLVTNYEPSSFQLSNLHLIVNTTPVGMTPHIDQSPLPHNLSIPKETRIYDLVYNPRETKLVKDAHVQGISATTGLGMLIEQAALAFELWTGYKPSREILHAAVDEDRVFAQRRRGANPDLKLPSTNFGG